MSEQNKDTAVAQMNNAMPTPPAKDEPVGTLDNATSGEPAATDETITTLNNAMPAPPALDLDGTK